MSHLEKYQAFVRKNGKEVTGIDVAVELSEEDKKNAALKFNFGWTISIGVSKHDHGGYRPSGEYYISCGSGASAKAEANTNAKEFLSGKDPLFNNRMKEYLSTDVSKNFILRDQDLRSASSQYLGRDTCYSCHGSGSNSCYSCSGSGKRSCSSCSGTGRRNTQRYDSVNERTVYSTESCGSCWGSGRNTCGTCSGSGRVTCSTCHGGGSLYCSYSIDGSASRKTSWKYENGDHHEWTESFLKSQQLSIIYNLVDIKEVDVEGSFGGCTFHYAMTAVLPTLQFKADVKGGSTYLKFAGKNGVTHDAGGVYDPAVWSLGKQLGAGNKKTDTNMLAVPAIKSIIESHETETSLDLVKQNWVSTDIRDAVINNYQELVLQLKKSSNKGLFGKLFTGLFKNFYLLIMFTSFIALLTPEFAKDHYNRIYLDDYFYFILEIISNYLYLAISLIYVFLVKKSINKLYWKRIGKFKTFVLTSITALVIPYAALAIFFAMINILNYDFHIDRLFLGGSVFISIYFLFWSFFWPNKWYYKPLAGIGALALMTIVQFGLMSLNGPIDIEAIKSGEITYLVTLEKILMPALKYVILNGFEVILIAILFTYFSTRRRFWLNAKNTVSEYNSPVLLKTMGMV